jgi:NAD(P)-dependent dehydrogenase (short-subunit alcohol dehydrogenase family)
VNQTSVFLGTKLAAEQMAKTDGGSIVNISSIMGFVGGPRGQAISLNASQSWSHGDV